VAVFAGVVAGALAVAPGAARAAGLFDFLFGGPQQRQAPPPAESYAEPSAPVAPAPLGPESVRSSGGSTGHGVAFCVRLCDGQHFPMEHLANATEVETCRSMCPATRTKVFFGSEIGTSTAKDGARYGDLDNAFIYRKQVVANCTCNGRNAFGLAPFDASNDPTLKPGDIVATKQGLVAFTGRNGTVAQFTPVDAKSVSDQLNSVTSRVAFTRRNVPAEAEDDPGTIATPQAPPPVNVGSSLRGQVAR
jgi:hypothetical protein